MAATFSSMKRLSRELVFRSDHLSQDLSRKSVRGGMASMVGQGSRFAVGLAGTMVLARLLTPNDFGLIGMVLVITGFADMFKNAGLSMATVTTERISHEQISTLFWLNVAISAVLGVCLLVGSPLVAMFFGRPELSAVTAMLSVSFILGGLAIQHQALLYRHMMFGTLAVIQIASQAVSLIVTIALACYGWSYWALVVGSLTLVTASALLTLFYCPWMPGWIKKDSGALGMLKFGGQLTVGNVVRYLSENMDKVLIGKFIGANPLGLYTKAFQLFMMPVRQIRDPIRSLAMPVLSSVRNQPDRYRRYYQRLLDVLASLTIPGALYCVIEADFLIRVILGPQWLQAVPIFRILAIAGLILPVAGTRGLVLVSMGSSRRFLWLETFNSLLCVGAFAAGLPFGIEGVATAYTIVTYVVFVPSLYYCFHKTPITVSLFMRTLVWPALISLIAAAGAVLVNYATGNDSIMDHVVFLSMFAGVYVMASCCRRSVRDTISQVLKELPVLSGKNADTKRVNTRLEV